MPGPWGKAIEALRLANRLTRKIVAKRARMTATTYGRIERGQHTLTSQLQAIADVFSVPIEAVLHIQGLPSATSTINTAHFLNAQETHEQSRAVQAVDSATTIHELRTTIRTLQTQLNLLQDEFAAIATEREEDRRRRQRLSAARPRKPLRPRNARKPGKKNAR